MPKKRSLSGHAPIHILEHLKWWGSEIRSARISQNLTAVELAERIGISHPTMGRIENGDGSVSVSSYLFAIYSLGLLGSLIKEPTVQQRAAESSSKRAKRDQLGDELGYF